MTKTINSSIRLYCESQRTDRFGPIGEYISVPDRGRGVPQGDVPHPARRTPRSRFNLVRYNRFDRGGHFAALEEPDLLVDDSQEFFGVS